MNRPLTSALCAVATAVAFTALAPAASAAFIGLGTANQYAVFAGPYINTFSFNGPGTITGNVGIGQNGKYNFASPAVINGTMYTDTGVTGTNSGVTISGGIVPNTNLSGVVTDANAAAGSATGLSATGTVPGGTIVVTNSTNAVTINGTAGTNVYHVTDINLNNGNLTLNGDASQTFILDVSGKFIVNGSANILLTGGLTANHVLFNIEGTGQDVSITGSTSGQVNGTILAPNRNVAAHDQTLNGAIISGLGSQSTSFQIQDTSGFRLNYVAFVPEPTSLALLALGGTALLARRRKA